MCVRACVRVSQKYQVYVTRSSSVGMLLPRSVALYVCSVTHSAYRHVLASGKWRQEGGHECAGSSANETTFTFTEWPPAQRQRVRVVAECLAERSDTGMPAGKSHEGSRGGLHDFLRERTSASTVPVQCPPTHRPQQVTT